MKAMVPKAPARQKTVSLSTHTHNAKYSHTSLTLIPAQSLGGGRRPPLKRVSVFLRILIHNSTQTTSAPRRLVIYILKKLTKIFFKKHFLANYWADRAKILQEDVMTKVYLSYFFCNARVSRARFIREKHVFGGGQKSCFSGITFFCWMWWKMIKVKFIAHLMPEIFVGICWGPNLLGSKHFDPGLVPTEK